MSSKYISEMITRKSVREWHCTIFMKEWVKSLDKTRIVDFLTEKKKPNSPVNCFSKHHLSLKSLAYRDISCEIYVDAWYYYYSNYRNPIKNERDHLYHLPSVRHLLSTFDHLWQSSWGTKLNCEKGCTLHRSCNCRYFLW